MTIEDALVLLGYSSERVAVSLDDRNQPKTANLHRQAFEVIKAEVEKHQPPKRQRGED